MQLAFPFLGWEIHQLHPKGEEKGMLRRKKHILKQLEANTGSSQTTQLLQLVMAKPWPAMEQETTAV